MHAHIFIQVWVDPDHNSKICIVSSMDELMKMKKWFDVKTVPESHVFPMEDRPGDQSFPLCENIPIIDLSNQDREETIHKIIQASKEYGFFQVINHGVDEDVIGEAVKVVEELLRRPAEENLKAAEENGWVYTGSSTDTSNRPHLWRDNLKHSCHPLKESMQHWPHYPTRYREVVATYIEEMGRLGSKILEAISEGLGLEKAYLGGISQVQFLTASNYPPCPDQSLTLGLRRHFDHGLLTILFQNGEGLQVMKDGNWMGVEVVPNSFVVNIGTQIQVITNRKLKSVEHRVVTNSKEGRTSLTTFINPNLDCIIEPSKLFVDEANPPLYPSLSFKDFVTSSKVFGPSTHVIQNIVHSN